MDMATRQREISISEFFLKNRHLLGFDTPSKGLVTAVREAVDNAIDACEEAGLLPEISVEIRERFGVSTVMVEDNGPGIVESQISLIFGKLLYGSKFHKLSQSRGQQGMGISAAGMYGQLTVGKPLHILSKVEGDALATELFVSIDTTKNKPDVHRKRQLEWDRPHGTRVEMQMEGHYQTGSHSVEVYLKQTAIANPHVTIRLVDPRGGRVSFERSVDELPPRPKEIKPHPDGIELGRLIQMLNSTKCRTLLQFLVEEFSSVGRKTAAQIIKNAGGQLSDRSYPKHIARAQVAALSSAIRKTPILAPRTDCIVPIGEQQLVDGLRKELDAEFYTVTTRPASSYRGNPFQVEVAIAYGQLGEASFELDDDSHLRKKQALKKSSSEHFLAKRGEPAKLLRYANRVPLLYQQSSCAITKAVIQTNWRSYGLSQTRGALPLAPMAVLVHVASVWVPYTSESKEAIEPYPELVKDIKLGVQQCGRVLALKLRRRARLHQEHDKRTYIEKYLPHIGSALQEILGVSDAERNQIESELDDALHKNRQTPGLRS